MSGVGTIEHEARERQTQVSMARAIVAHSTGLKESVILDIESQLVRRVGLEPAQVENAIIEKAKEAEPPKRKG